MNDFLKTEDLTQANESSLLGKSQALSKIMQMIERVKDAEVPVFISGESGTGKELVAQTIHTSGHRCLHRFISLNCGAIPDFLLESELFGFARGAFTGAVRSKPGLIEEAQGGTFFLDEIGDLSFPLQSKLLRLLQEKEIRRIGENRFRQADVRFISATNKDIEKEVENGRFREDLYYRIKIISIEVPPLRERKEDLLFLLEHFTDKYCLAMNRPKAHFTPTALKLMMGYSWPGNVRELQNEIQRILILSENDNIIHEDLLSSRVNPSQDSRMSIPRDFFQAKAAFEKTYIREALLRCNFHRMKTAEDLGLSRQGLFKLMKKHNIQTPKNSRQKE